MTTSSLVFFDALFRSVVSDWEATNLEIDQRRYAVAEEVALTWDVELPAMESEFHSLVARGDWQRGPDDMFSILGLERNEVRHSAMIAWLLDPIGRHGLGSVFLDAVLKSCFPGETLAIGGATTVACEVARGDTRADTVVWSRDFTLIIENKVDAGEGNRQCNRIYQHFSEEPGALFLFVTPSGRRPKTATGDAAAAFSTLSFRQIRVILQGLADEQVDVVTVGNSTVQNYLQTLRKEFP